MMKRAAFLGLSAVMMVAANPPGAANGWEGPRHYDCYRSHCYPRYGAYHWHGEYPREEYPHYRSEPPHYHYRFIEYPRSEGPHYHYHYYDYPRDSYVRYGRGYDSYDNGYYRYYSASRYDDYGYYGYDW